MMIYASALTALMLICVHTGYVSPGFRAVFTLSSFPAAKPTPRSAVSSSCLVVLACPDSAGGDLGRARAVPRRGVLFFAFVKESATAVRFFFTASLRWYGLISESFVSREDQIISKGQYAMDFRLLNPRECGHATEPTSMCLSTYCRTSKDEVDLLTEPTSMCLKHLL